MKIISSIFVSLPFSFIIINKQDTVAEVTNDWLRAPNVWKQDTVAKVTNDWLRAPNVWKLCVKPKMILDVFM